MSLSVFLEVVEIRTKVASVFPFIMGVLFSLVYFHEFHPLNTVIFLGMLLFDLTTTSINNYMDFKSQIRDLQIPAQCDRARKHLRSYCSQSDFAMLAGTLLIGLYLTFVTGWLLLVMGLVVCFIGSLYLWPHSVIADAFRRGIQRCNDGIRDFAITIYINTIDQKVFYLALDFANGTFGLVGNLWAV